MLTGPERNLARRCALFSGRVLLAIPYHSSKRTTEETNATDPELSPFSNCVRTEAGFPLISAMHALVSSKYLNEKTCGAELLAGCGPSEEGFRIEAVKLGEPLADIGDNGLEQDSSFNLADPHAVTLEPKLFRQAHGLAAAVTE